MGTIIDKFERDWNESNPYHQYYQKSMNTMVNPVKPVEKGDPLQEENQDPSKLFIDLMKYEYAIGRALVLLKDCTLNQCGGLAKANIEEAKKLLDAAIKFTE